MPAGTLGSPKVSGNFRSTYEPDLRPVPRNPGLLHFSWTTQPPVSGYRGHYLRWQRGRSIQLTTTPSNTAVEKDHGLHKDAAVLILLFLWENVPKDSTDCLDVAPRGTVIRSFISSFDNIKLWQLQFHASPNCQSLRPRRQLLLNLLRRCRCIMTCGTASWLWESEQLQVSYNLWHANTVSFRKHNRPCLIKRP